MALPLPNVVYDTKPGGNFITSLSGINDLRNQFLKGQEQAINNQYLPQNLQNKNILGQLVNQFYGPNIESEIRERQAQANRINTMTPLEAMQLSLQNKYYPQLTESQIANNNALAQYRDFGGGRGGVGSANDMRLLSYIAKDNPQLSRDEVYEASNVLQNGGNQLASGKQLNPLSPMAQNTLNQILKGTTTSQLYTQGVKANQADAELQILNDYAQKGLEPYGDTYFNKSPSQIADSFKSDKESQERLGRFIASKALQYEAAQNRIKLANGQPGVNSTEELVKLSGQSVDSEYPKLSYQARKEAARYLDEALAKGLEARNKVGLNYNPYSSRQDNRIKSAANEGNSNFNLEDIQHTANKYNLSTEQVIKMLGGK